MRTTNHVLTATAFCLLLLAPGASAQMAHTWDVKSRQHAENLKSAGITQLQLGQTEKAIGIFRKAASADPTNANPYNALGMALAKQGNYGEALDAFHKAYSLKPSSETLLATGVVYYLQRDYDAAINSWNKIVEANPKLCHVYGDIGFALMRKGQFSEAETYFDKLVRCHPNTELGYHGLAMVRYLTGDFIAAKQAADRAESLSSYAPVVLLQAKLDFLRGDVSRGTRRAQQYNRITSNRKWKQRPMTEIGFPLQHEFHWDPFLSDSWDNGYLLMARAQPLPQNQSAQRSFSRRGKAQLAIATAQEVLKDHPDDLFVLRELGLAQLADGDNSSAADTFEKVLRVSRNANVDLLHLARALALDGKVDQASEQVREFRRRQPRQQLAPAFSEIGKVDPALQHETQTRNELPPTVERGKQPVPATEF